MKLEYFGFNLKEDGIKVLRVFVLGAVATAILQFNIDSPHFGLDLRTIEGGGILSLLRFLSALFEEPKIPATEVQSLVHDATPESEQKVITAKFKKFNGMNP